MKSKKKFTKKKRRRSNSQKNLENSIKNDFIINKDNKRYNFYLSINGEKGQIVIKCTQCTTSFDFETKIKLETLKQKCRNFNACFSLVDAYKIISNLFKNKKVKIKEENNDSIVIILILLNYIEDREENINLKLTKIKNNENKLKLEKNPNKNIQEKNQNDKNNLCLEFQQKLINLIKNDQSKDIQIKRLEKNINELKKVHDELENEILAIKKSVGMNFNNKLDQENNNKLYEHNEEYEKQQEFEINSELIKNLKCKNEKNNETIKRYKNKSKSEIKSTKLNIIKIKEIKNRIENKPKSIPRMVYVKSVTKKIICNYLGENTFVVFKTINKESLVAFASTYNSIHFYNIDIEKISRRISNAHDYEITNLRYSYDKNQNRDLLLSISNKNMNIKVWDILKLNCIVSISNIYDKGEIYSSCFLIDENYKKNYIIAINYDNDNLKVFDFEGKIVKEIGNDEDKSFLVETFYNSKSKKYYIVVGNEKYIVSYNYLEGSIYHKYIDNISNSNCSKMNFVVSSKDKGVNLIESDTFGYVRIWDFNKGLLLKKILVEKKMKLRALCLWNYKYIFVGAEDKKIKLIDIENNIEVDNLKCNDNVFTIKKIITSKYGECFLFQGNNDKGQIKLWRNEYSK